MKTIFTSRKDIKENFVKANGFVVDRWGMAVGVLWLSSRSETVEFRKNNNDGKWYLKSTDYWSAERVDQQEKDRNSYRWFDSKNLLSNA